MCEESKLHFAHCLSWEQRILGNQTEPYRPCGHLTNKIACAARMCGHAQRSTIHLKDKHTKNPKKNIFNRSVWETPPQLNMCNNFPAQKISFSVQVHTHACNMWKHATQTCSLETAVLAGSLLPFTSFNDAVFCNTLITNSTTRLMSGN